MRVDGCECRKTFSRQIFKTRASLIFQSFDAAFVRSIDHPFPTKANKTQTNCNKAPENFCLDHSLDGELIICVLEMLLNSLGTFKYS